MRFLKWGLGLFFALLIGVVLIFEFLNWNQYKSIAITKVKEITNRNLVINGNLKIRLIPTPHLIVNDISLSNAPGAADKNMIEVKEVKISLSLLPLLAGRIHFSTISLDNPVIHLQKNKDTKPNWEFETTAADVPKSPKEEDGLKSFLKSDPAFNLEISNGKISNGILTYQDGSSLTTLSDMNLNFVIDGTKGPYAIQGKLTVNKTFPLSFNLETEKLTEKGVNFILAFQENDMNLNFKGMLKPDTFTLTGNLTGDGQFKNDRIKGDKATLKADIEATQSEISLKNIFLTFGPEKASGMAHIKLGTPLQILATLNDLPGSTKVTLDTRQGQQGTSGNVKIISKNLYKLLKTFAVDIKGLQPASMFNLETQFNIIPKTEKANFDKLSITLNNSALHGNIGVHYKQNDYSSNMDLKISHMDELLKTFGVETEKKMETVTLKGTLAGSLEQLKINQQIGLWGGNVSMDGYLKNLTTDISYDMNILASLPQLLQAKGHISGTPRKITFTNADLTYNEMQAHGNGNVDLSGTRYKINGEFKMKKGNMAAFGAPASTTSSQRSASHKAKGSPKGAPWTSDKLPLDTFKKTDVDLKLSGEFLQLGKLIIQHPHIDIRVLNGKIDIQQTGKLADGELINSLSGTIENNIKATFSSSLKKAHIQQLGGMFANYTDLDGFIEYSLALSTEGNSTLSLVKNLNGKANFHTISAAILGYDFQSFKKSLENLGTGLKLSNIDDLFKTTKQKGKRTNIHKCAADFTVSNGVFNSQNFELTGDGLSGKGTIILNLPSWTLDSKGEIYIQGLEKAGGIPLYARGSLDNIQYGFQGDSFMKYLFQNILQETLKKNLKIDLQKPEEILKGEKPQKIIGDLLGKVLH